MQNLVEISPVSLGTGAVVCGPALGHPRFLKSFCVWELTWGTPPKNSSKLYKIFHFGFHLSVFFFQKHLKKPFWEFIEFERFIPSFWDTPNGPMSFFEPMRLGSAPELLQSDDRFLPRKEWLSPLCIEWCSLDDWMVGWLDGWKLNLVESSVYFQKDTLDVSLAESCVSLRIFLVKLDLEEASTNFLVLVQCWWQWLLLLDDVPHPLQTLSQARAKVEFVALD